MEIFALCTVSWKIIGAMMKSTLKTCWDVWPRSASNSLSWPIDTRPWGLLKWIRSLVAQIINRVKCSWNINREDSSIGWNCQCSRRSLTDILNMICKNCQRPGPQDSPSTSTESKISSWPVQISSPKPFVSIKEKSSERYSTSPNFNMSNQDRFLPRSEPQAKWLCSSSSCLFIPSRRQPPSNEVGFYWCIWWSS